MGFINNFNKYRSGSDEQMLTQLFTGSGIVVNRVSSEPVNIPDTCIGVIGTILPDVLKDFARNKISSGFIDRWLFAYPDKVRYPELNDNEIDGKIPKEWNRIVSRILGIKYDGRSKQLPFSTEAKAAFYDWFNNLARQKIFCRNGYEDGTILHSLRHGPGGNSIRLRREQAEGNLSGERQGCHQSVLLLYL